MREVLPSDVSARGTPPRATLHTCTLRRDCTVPVYNSALPLIISPPAHTATLQTVGYIRVADGLRVWTRTVSQSYIPNGVRNKPVEYLPCPTSVSFIYLFIHYKQLGRHPVAGVVTCYISTDYEDFTGKFRYGGLQEKHVVATWNCREPSQHLL